MIWQKLITNKHIDVVGDMNTNYQKSIIIQTTIKSSNHDAHKLVMETEKTINEILHFEELNSVSTIDSYTTIILLDNKSKEFNS
ncbi:hypothetical protein CSV61_16125 [Sporosarcina sp. P3]|nr:hypothetical protein SporoP17a_01735 [Sporosarcina ureae]PID20144.1 hypothetical protein CSV61_16125 [Sporosarcina sp. P3]